MDEEQAMKHSEPATLAGATLTERVSDSQGIDLKDILLFWVIFRRHIAWSTGVFLLVGLVVALLLRPVFTATTVIMPPQQEQSASSMLAGQLGPLGGLGASSALGLKNPADMYVSILGSREIADRLIDRFQLMSVYHLKTRMDTRKKLRRNSDLEAAKDGLIYINVNDHDPQRAAALANAYVEELHQTNSRLATTQAGQRRLFYDEKLTDEKKALAAAEEDLKQTQERTGLVQLNGQTEMTIRSIASKQAEIASREVELGSMHAFATDENPRTQSLREEITTLRSQLTKLESSESGQLPGNTQISAARIPAVDLDYLRKLREERFHESLFELMSKEREMASLQEAKTAPLIQIIDHAEAPERKSGPSRILIVLGFTFAGLVISSLLIIACNLLAIPMKRKSNDRFAETVQQWLAR